MKELEKKKMSLKAKIIAIISLIAFLGAVVVLVMIFMTGDKFKQNQNTRDDITDAVKNISSHESLQFVLTTLNGDWFFDNQFAAFTSVVDKQFVEYGLYATSYSVRGEVMDAKTTGENSFSLTIFVPAVPANEMDEARPEKTETIYVDISNFKKDSRLNLKIDALGDGEWHTYGKTFEFGQGTY